MSKIMMLGAYQRESSGVCANLMSALGTQGGGEGLGSSCILSPFRKLTHYQNYIKILTSIVRHVCSMPCQCENSNFKIKVENKYSA